MVSYKTSHTVDLFSKYFSSNWECEHSPPLQIQLPISPEVMFPVFIPEKDEVRH